MAKKAKREVKIRCQGSGTADIADLHPFQGNLKTLSKESYLKLRGLIEGAGYSFPVFVWRSPDDKLLYLLDGHQRRGTLQVMRDEGWAVPPIPYAEVFAATFKEAREKLVAVLAQFGKIDGQGLYEFMGESDMDLSYLSANIELPDFDLGAFTAEYFEEKAGKEGDEKKPDDDYTRKIEPPIYEPKGDRPAVASLVDRTKTEKLLAAIDGAAVPDDVKEFLRHAAGRHAVFNYERIAEFYAHAPKELQGLMEDSALVIIDFGKAIENGFVVLSEELAEAYRDDE